MRSSGIIGTGAVGTNLARALHARGYPMHSIISRSTASGHQLAVETQALHVVHLGAPIPPGLQQLFICVPDDCIAHVAQLLAEQSYAWQGVVVGHTSGALTANALAPLKSAGASTLSFHPFQTFAQHIRTDFEDIFIGIEGDSAAINSGIELAKKLNATPLLLSASEKTLYHASAVVASNFFITLISVAMDLLEQTGLKRHETLALLTPLIKATSQNVTQTLPEHVLTGPASRGDQATIMRHIDALNKHFPNYSTLYRLMTEHTLNLACRDQRISEDQLNRLLNSISHEKDE